MELPQRGSGEMAGGDLLVLQLKESHRKGAAARGQGKGSGTGEQRCVPPPQPENQPFFAAWIDEFKDDPKNNRKEKVNALQR